MIQVIAAMSLLPSHKLGWDPTMRLYLPKQPKDKQFQRSFVYYGHKTSEKLRLYETHWAIDMPGEHPEDNDETFITVAPLPVVSAEVLSGRGTLVWEALRLRHIENEKILAVRISPTTYLTRIVLTASCRSMVSSRHGARVQYRHCLRRRSPKTRSRHPLHQPPTLPRLSRLF